MTKPAEIADMIAYAPSASSAGSTSWSTTPASSTSRRSRTSRIEKWDQIIAINLTSTFHATRAAVPIMKAQGRGRIVNIASAHGLVASPFKSAYVAAKHGVVGLTKTVALEVAEHGDHLQRHLPGLCEDAAGRGPDRRPGQGARHDAGAGDRRT